MKPSFVLRHYEIKTPRLPCGESVVVGLVSDLHGRSGDGLTDALREAKADLIAVCGDLIENYLPPGEEDDYHRLIRESGKGRFLRFLHRVDAHFVGKRRATRSNWEANAHLFPLLAAFAEIAPTVYCPGNHERSLTKEMLSAIREAGVLFLSNAEAEISVKERTLRVGGSAILCDFAFLRRFADGDGVRILLCHCPEYYPRYLWDKGYDLVLSGHAHGGQIRLFGKGLFAPGQGFFPKYDGGVYHGNFVVGRGLCNTTLIPRLFNPRELPIVHLVGTGEK